MQPNLHRYTIKVTGESGQGINSFGEIVTRAAKEAGWFSFGYREYPSLIRGGFASHQVDLSDGPIASPSRDCNLLICLSRVAFHEYLGSVRLGGFVLFTVAQMDISETEQALIDERQLTVWYVPASALAKQAGGTGLMANTIMLGVVWQLLNQELPILEAVVKAEFANKPNLIAPNIACLELGFVHQLQTATKPNHGLAKSPTPQHDMLLTGNHALTLGAIAAGVRAYYAYPMTPSSSILTFMTDYYHKTGILVKQLEDEITVAQMALGSFFAGTRALVATSGGGFDLMTETISLSGMTETPFVCILAQRPGPATGLPTWTSSSDLNVAVYAGHGEFSRCVLAASDVASCYTLIQHAFNLAEKHQLPVIVLTDKEIAESLYQVTDLPKDLPIERHLVPTDQLQTVQPSDRFSDAGAGTGLRWLPGQSDATYLANSDEHLADGSMTEAAQASKTMYDKRLRKLAALKAELPPPVKFGPDQAKIGLVGWGSVKSSVLDAINIWNTDHPKSSVSYLHYEYIYPLKFETFIDYSKTVGRVVLIEQNALGQLGGLITQESGYIFNQKLLKYDGRPFFIEDLLDFIAKEFN